jgi:flagellar biosynthetic protein FliP
VTARRRLLGALIVMLVAASAGLAAQPSQLDVNVDGIGSVSAPLQVVIFLTLLTFIPAALVIMTSFTRIAIVFHFLRQALGTQEMPSNQILIGLALFLTMFIMAPVATRISTDALQPALAGEVTVSEALARGTPPLLSFMLRQSRETDLRLFVVLSRAPRPASAEDLPMRVVIPAYVIS